jgi:DNA-binding IclR family transcriptional regulator
MSLKPDADVAATARACTAARSPDPDMVKSGERVLDILDFFRHWRRPARAVQVSRTLGLPHSSVDRMLKTMVNKGYLTFEEGRKLYAPSYRIVQTGSEIERAFYGGPSLGRVVEGLRRETAKTAFVCVQNGWLVQNVVTLPGENFVPRIHQEGLTAPVLASAPGLALLAAKSDAEVMETARRSIRSHPVAQSWLLPDLIEHVHRVRQRRFSSWKGFSYPDAVAVCAAVRVAPDQPPISIGFVGHNPRESEETEAALGSILLSVISRYPEVRVAAGSEGRRKLA